MRELIRANAGLLLVGVTTFVMMGAGQSLYGPALPAFARDLALSGPEAGWLVSAHWIGCAFGVAGMYFRGTHVSPRMVLATMALGAGLLALGAGLWITVLGALVFGTGYGAATVAFNPRILKAFGPGGTSMLSLLNASFGIGAIAAPLGFVALGSVPARAYAVVAVMAVAIWLAAGPLGRRDGPTVEVTPGPFRPRFGLLMFAVLGIGIEACLIGLGPTALIAAGLTEASAAQHLSMFFVAFLGSRLVLVFAAHLIRPFTIYLCAMMLAATSALLAIWLSPGVFFVALGAAAGMFFPSFYVAASRAMGDDPRVAPTIIAAGLVGGIASPILLGAVMDGLGQTGFFWVMGAAAALAAGAGVVVRQTLPELRT